MIHLAAMILACGAMQDPVVGAIERAQQEYLKALVELGPDAIPELEKRAGGAQGQFMKEVIEEIRRRREPIEKLVEQMASGEAAARDWAAMELLKIGRPARSYLEKAGQKGEARAASILRKSPFRNLQQAFSGHGELELIRERARAELQLLRVKAMEAEVAKGRVTTLDLIRARREAEKGQYKVGEITRDDYLNSARRRTAEELEWFEKESARGRAGTLDVLKVRLQLLYVDRRLGRDVEEEIKRTILEASRRLRLEDRPFTGLSNPAEVLEELIKLSRDRDEDLD